MAILKNKKTPVTTKKIEITFFTCPGCQKIYTKRENLEGHFLFCSKIRVGVETVLKINNNNERDIYRAAANQFNPFTNPDINRDID